MPDTPLSGKFELDLYGGKIDDARHSAVGEVRARSLRRLCDRDLTRHFGRRRGDLVQLSRQPELGGTRRLCRVSRQADRKSVVQGKSVSVRVDLGGRRIIKKKNTIKT